MCTCLWLPLLGKALLQCCGFSGNGGVLLGNRGGGVGAEAVKLRGQLVVGHGQNRHSQIRGVLRAVQRYSSHGKAAGHLHSGQQGVQTVRDTKVSLTENDADIGSVSLEELGGCAICDIQPVAREYETNAVYKLLLTDEGIERLVEMVNFHW